MGSNDDVNVHNLKKRKFAKKKRWDGYFNNLYMSDSTSESDAIGSDSDSSTTSFCDIYGPEIVSPSPPAGPYYSAFVGRGGVDSDVGLNIDYVSPLRSTQSGETVCCDNHLHDSKSSASEQAPVVGVVTYI